MADLFSPLLAGDLSLANRIVMAPLTRSRAGADGVPTETMAEHYAQRASVGLIISEAPFKAFPGQLPTVSPASSPPRSSPARGRSPTRCTRRED